MVIPVVASPLISYIEVLNSIPGTEAGYIAYSPEEWNQSLILLKNDAIRKKMSTGALKLSKKYSPATISKCWYDLFLSLYSFKIL